MTGLGIAPELSINTIKSRFDQTLPHALPTNVPAAAVLILLIEKQNIEVVFTQRSAFVRNHKNEVAFPGGAYEKADTTLYRTALRETCEEISVCSSAVQFIGSLDPFTTHYNLEIFPYIASIDEKTFLSARPDEEVTAIFSIPLCWLMEHRNWEFRNYRSENTVREVIFYQPYNGYTVWGMTAGILQNFIEVIKNRSVF